MKLLAKQLVTWALLMAALVAIPTAAQGSIQLGINSVNATQGSNGYVELSLVNLGGSQTVSGFSVEIEMPAPQGVTFTGVDSSTTLPYIFGTEGSGSLTSDTFPNTSFIVIDSSFNQDGYVTLSSNQSVGLARIAFHVNSSAPNGFRAVNVVFGTGTEFTDARNNVIPFDFQVVETSYNGGINVQGIQAVPEPATLLMWTLGLGLGSLGYARRRQTNC